MKDKTLIDTNVLVYAYDSSNPKKQKQAITTIEELIEEENGVISTQVLSEFFVVATKKLSTPLTLDEASERLENFIRIWQVLEISSLIVIEAVRGVKQHSLSFWDALIWATAKLNQISVILSEDFNKGQIIEGVEFTSPFK